MQDHDYEYLISDARDWLADAYPSRDFSGASENSVYRLVDTGYEGGWSAFVTDNDTFATLPVRGAL